MLTALMLAVLLLTVLMAEVLGMLTTLMLASANVRTA